MTILCPRAECTVNGCKALAAPRLLLWPGGDGQLEFQAAARGFRGEGPGRQAVLRLCQVLPRFMRIIMDEGEATRRPRDHCYLACAAVRGFCLELITTGHLRSRARRPWRCRASCRTRGRSPNGLAPTLGDRSPEWSDEVSGKFRDKFTAAPLGRKRVDPGAADASSLARWGRNPRLKARKSMNADHVSG